MQAYWDLLALGPLTSWAEWRTVQIECCLEELEDTLHHALCYCLDEVARHLGLGGLI